jgi:hypothetical protein
MVALLVAMGIALATTTALAQSRVVAPHAMPDAGSPEVRQAIGEIIALRREPQEDELVKAKLAAAVREMVEALSAIAGAQDTSGLEAPVARLDASITDAQAAYHILQRKGAVPSPPAGASTQSSIGDPLSQLSRARDAIGAASGAGEWRREALALRAALQRRVPSPSDGADLPKVQRLTSGLEGTEASQRPQRPLRTDALPSSHKVLAPHAASWR